MNRLRVIRAEKRISQFLLRLQTGISTSKISLIENSLLQPTQEEKSKIAKALGVDVGDIFLDEGLIKNAS